MKGARRFGVVLLAALCCATGARAFGFGAAQGSPVVDSAALDAAFGSTRGALLVRGASGWVVLEPGTAGHVLTSGGPSADPSWQPK